MAAKWGSWDNSLVFLKPHFGALSAVLAPFFCLVMALSCAYICVTVTFAWLLCLACSIWGQDARTRAFSVCLRLLYQLQVTPVYQVCLSCFFFSLPSLGRGMGPDQGRDELCLAHGLFLPCMAFLEQDEWHVISLNSQTLKADNIPCRSKNRLNKVKTCPRVHSC